MQFYLIKNGVQSTFILHVISLIYLTNLKHRSALVFFDFRLLIKYLSLLIKLLKNILLIYLLVKWSLKFLLFIPWFYNIFVKWQIL